MASISKVDENVCLFVFISSLGVCIYLEYFLDMVINQSSNEKYLLELIMRRSKVREKNVSREIAIRFYQWQTFSENCKPIRVSLWFVYKKYWEYCRLRLFIECIQTQRRYPNSFDKIVTLTLRLLVILNQNIFLNVLRIYSLRNILDLLQYVNMSTLICQFV